MPRSSPLCKTNTHTCRQRERDKKIQRISLSICMFVAVIKSHRSVRRSSWCICPPPFPSCSWAGIAQPPEWAHSPFLHTLLCPTHIHCPVAVQEHECTGTSTGMCVKTAVHHNTQMQ